MSFEQDCLVEGGSLKFMNNGTGYQEVRQYQSDHHLVRFDFLTKIYSSYLQSVLNDLYRGLKPDVVIVNSCMWDISRWAHLIIFFGVPINCLLWKVQKYLFLLGSCRYDLNWHSEYEENLKEFFLKLREVLPRETLTIWNLTMPLGQNIRGGFLTPQVRKLESFPRQIQN